MKFNKIVSSLVIATAVLASGSAFAEMQKNGELYPFAEIMAKKMMDKNKDGMVSKKEYMDMMTMVWEMKAKKMGIKDNKMTDAQFAEILMYLKAGS